MTGHAADRSDQDDISIINTNRAFCSCRLQLGVVTGQLISRRHAVEPYLVAYVNPALLDDNR